MRNISNASPLYIVLALFAFYLILKWTCRLIFGLLDYAILIGLIAGVIWYCRLPEYKKKHLHEKAKSGIKYIAKKLGI